MALVAVLGFLSAHYESRRGLKVQGGRAGGRASWGDGGLVGGRTGCVGPG
jgi:hypothetical protein